ncbi:MAG TPA: YdcF family protein [Chryseolinea sp.]|nr:YdcF family protein [Chryseolinea sp.]
MKKVLRIFLYFHLFLAVALLLTHCSFSHYAKKSYERATKKKPFDVIIVPGVPYEQENTTSIMTMRVLWAKQLYDSGFTKNIIFSGSAVYSPYVEGIVMKTIADSLGIPPDHTFSETKAEHSTENIYYSWKMARSMGFQKIALSTDPFQSIMLRGFIKKYTPGITAIPVVFDRLDIKGKSLPPIDYASGYIPNFVNIKKRESFWQRLQGTMGRRVKEEVKAEKKERSGGEKVIGPG